MPDQRLGTAWRLTERHLTATQYHKLDELIELIPVQPKGWMIYINEMPAYAGLVFTKDVAMTTILHRRDRALKKAAIWGPESVKWEELPRRCLPREAPPIAAKTMIPNLPDEDEEGNPKWAYQEAKAKRQTKAAPQIKLLPAAAKQQHPDAPEKPSSILKSAKPTKEKQ